MVVVEQVFHLTHTLENLQLNQLNQVILALMDLEMQVVMHNLIQMVLLLMVLVAEAQAQ